MIVGLAPSCRSVQVLVVVRHHRRRRQRRRSRWMPVICQIWKSKMSITPKSRHHRLHEKEVGGCDYYRIVTNYDQLLKVGYRHLLWNLHFKENWKLIHKIMTRKSKRKSKSCIRMAKTLSDSCQSMPNYAKDFPKLPFFRRQVKSDKRKLSF